MRSPASGTAGSCSSISSDGSRAEKIEATLLMIFDLDGFKGYNDTFGHPAGDALLSRLGEKLAGVPGSQGAAYRLGGDEFCLIAVRRARARPSR